MEFYGYHGVLPEENTLGQRFFVDVELHVDLRDAGISDNLNDTIHYGEVYELVKQIMEGPPKQLIESLAEEIAQKLLQTYPALDSCVITLTKPNPPIKGHYRNVAVEIMRSRDGK